MQQALAFCEFWNFYCLSFCHVEGEWLARCCIQELDGCLYMSSGEATIAGWGQVGQKLHFFSMMLSSEELKLQAHVFICTLNV